MAKLKNRQALETLRDSLQAESQKSPKLISLCAGSGCGAYGTAKVHSVLQDELAKYNLQDQVKVKLTGCHGFCEKGPIMVIHPEGIFYPQVTPEKVPDIVKTTIVGRELVDKLVYKDPVTKKKISHEHEIPFYKHQQRIVFGNNGLDRPDQHRGLHRRRRLRGAGQGPPRHDARGHHRGDQEVGAARPRAAAGSPPARKWETLPRGVRAAAVRHLQRRRGRPRRLHGPLACWRATPTA